MKVRRQCFGTLPYNKVVELSSLCSALIAALLDDYLLAVVDVDASGQVGSGGEALSHHVIVSVVASGCLVAADGGDGCGQLPVHDIRRVAHDGGLAPSGWLVMRLPSALGAMRFLAKPVLDLVLTFSCESTLLLLVLRPSNLTCAAALATSATAIIRVMIFFMIKVWD